MKIIGIKPESEKPALPPVGTFWCHNRKEHLYLRIDDETGRKLLPFVPSDEGVFFSIAVSTGDIVYSTPERCSKIILVQPSEMETRST